MWDDMWWIDECVQVWWINEKGEGNLVRGYFIWISAWASVNVRSV